jgi:acetylornithine deacetylase/succinyl-diaminopimelate desuccinylase-like protein
MTLNKDQLYASIAQRYDQSIVPALVEYIRIPNKSPLFDPDWEVNGHMQAAVDLMANWCRSQAVPGMTVEVRCLPKRTPVLLVTIPGEAPGNVLLYGHLDKQPEFTGWLPGLGPWEPVLRDGKLYGRGGADDGYAVFSSLAAILALREQGVKLPRCTLLIEASEESGSIDLPAHLDALGDTLGTPDLVICLDAESGNYEQLWCTTSLRGIIVGTLKIGVLSEGVHSGMGTGIAPTPMRIAMELLTRLENPVTGDLLLDALITPLPTDRLEQIKQAAAVLGPEIAAKMPFVAGARAVSNDPVELLVGSTWRATLAITGAQGLPPIAQAGNVLLPELALKLSIRLAPTTDPQRALAAVKSTLERDPPYGAKVAFESSPATKGWNAPSFAPWLEQSMARASNAVFGRTAIHIGCGGSIPFMGMLGERFPRTQFLITGVLGPHANAHGPNEFLHIEYTKKITTCVALVLADFARELGAK